MSMQVQIKRFTGVLYNNLTTMPHIWFDALRCKIKGISSKSIENSMAELQNGQLAVQSFILILNHFFNGEIIY